MLHLIEQSIKRVVAEFFADQGYKIVRTPRAVIRNPSAELGIELGYIICHRLSQVSPSEFFFVQIGAFDGVTNDPVYEFVMRYGLRGILIEPQREAFCALKENYRHQSQLVLLNVAISDRNGTRDLYRIRSDVKGLPPWSCQVASFSLDTILRHGHDIPTYGIQGIPNIEELIEVEQVECMTFDTLLDRYGVDRIDLLQIDAEGYDAEIVKSVNFARVKPCITCYEHMHLTSEQQDECIQILVDQGYQVAVGYADTVAYLSR
jgi:FkbM family methyltransferase